ncbi:conserved hypothetical protein [Ricinus communis]|uniref:Uncharacterized protein n=1 Tax=Ricinus communis TaxID=3988 RepID=B9TNQ2_RICCO|nr:conserved hypothetical protein [Ricinus communis]
MLLVSARRGPLLEGAFLRDAPGHGTAVSSQVILRFARVRHRAVAVDTARLRHPVTGGALERGKVLFLHVCPRLAVDPVPPPLVSACATRAAAQESRLLPAA